MERRHLIACLSALGFLAVAAALMAQGSTSNVGEGPPGTLGTCPCAAGTPENEADCGLPTDTTNGGCNSNPVVLTSVSCNETICGTVGSLDGTRDTDWWELVLPIPDNVTVTATMETDIALFEIVDPVCPATVGDQDLQPACVQAQINFAGSVGPNWIFIAGQAFDGDPCGTEYTMTVNCEVVPVELQTLDVSP